MAQQQVVVAPERNPNLVTIPLDVARIGNKSFRRFISAVLGLCSDGFHLGLPVLVRQVEPEELNYFFIDLINGEHTITVLARKTDLYLVAFFNDVTIFYFPIVSPLLLSQVFRNFNAVRSFKLTFRPAYEILEKKANLKNGREEFSLSFRDLDRVISEMWYLSPMDHHRNSAIAKFFILVIQVLSEALRFKGFNNKVQKIASDLELSFEPNKFDTECQLNWKKLSTVVLRHTDLLALVAAPFELDGKRIEKVKDAKGILQVTKTDPDNN